MFGALLQYASRNDPWSALLWAVLSVLVALATPVVVLLLARRLRRRRRSGTLTAAIVTAIVVAVGSLACLLPSVVVAVADVARAAAPLDPKHTTSRSDVEQDLDALLTDTTAVIGGTAEYENVTAGSSFVACRLPNGVTGSRVQVVNSYDDVDASTVAGDVRRVWEHAGYPVSERGESILVSEGGHPAELLQLDYFPSTSSVVLTMESTCIVAD